MNQHTSEDLFRLLHVQLEKDAERTRKIQERLKGLWAEAGFPVAPSNGHETLKPKGKPGFYSRTPESRRAQARAMRRYWAKKKREQGK